MADLAGLLLNREQTRDRDAVLRLRDSASATYEARLALDKTTTRTAAATEVERIQVTSTGTAAASLAARHKWFIENGSGNFNEMHRKDVIIATVTDASEDATVQYSVMKGGTLTQVFELKGSDQTVNVAGRLTTTDGVASGTVRVVGGRANQIVAASTAITNTSTETAFSNGAYTIPANTMKASTSIRFRAFGIATATNSTDTLTITVRLGATGVTAQIVAQTIALDVADNDIFVIDGLIVIRTAGASGTMVAMTQHSIGVPDTATTRQDSMASAAIDTTVARDLTVTATWSVASASNSCRLDIFEVQIE